MKSNQKFAGYSLLKAFSLPMKRNIQGYYRYFVVHPFLCLKNSYDAWMCSQYHSNQKVRSQEPLHDRADIQKEPKVMNYH